MNNALRMQVLHHFLLQSGGTRYSCSHKTTSASKPPGRLTAISGDSSVAVETIRKKQTKIIPFRFGTWNVRTLMDSAGSDRPQRRTALVGRELVRYRIQIAALSETRFADVGEIKEVGAGYIFFWDGRKSEEKREAGVGFAIKTELVGKLSGFPKSINDRLMTLRLPLSGNKHATIASAYAPTMTNLDDVKDNSIMT